MKQAAFFIIITLFAAPGFAAEHAHTDLQVSDAQIVERRFSSADRIEQMIRAAVLHAQTNEFVESGNFYNAALKGVSSRRYSGFRGFVEDCMEAEVVPITTFHSSDDKRVVFGVNFDGILGVHVTMK